LQNNKRDKMKAAIMQPYLFPYLGYFQLIHAVDTFVIFDDVNFINRSFINRNSILVNNEKHLFSLELVKSSQNKLINQIEVGGNREKLLKTIQMAYKKAPFFCDIYPLLGNILLHEENNLAVFLGQSIKKISEFLGLKTQFIYSSDLNKDNKLSGQDKIIEITKILNADTYINAIGGQSIYEKPEFKKNGIQMYFLNTKITKYKQFTDEFVPNLSIIDIMMFNNSNQIKKMLNNHEFI